MKKRLYSYLFLILSISSISTISRCDDSYVSKTTLGALTLLVGGTIAALIYNYFNKKTDAPQKFPVSPSIPIVFKQEAKKPEFAFFWRIQADKNGALTIDEDHYKFLSQWYFSPFNAFNKRFNTAEHFMMYFKALHFAKGPNWQVNTNIASAILNKNTGEEAKNLGKRVVGLDSREWDDVSEFYVYAGNMEKFSQSFQLKKELLNTGTNFLAEASPYDKVWGIGVKDTDSRAKNPQQWQGKNKLGYVLMMVRAELRKPASERFRPALKYNNIKDFVVNGVKNPNSQMMLDWKKKSESYKKEFDAIKEKM